MTPSVTPHDTDPQRKQLVSWFLRRNGGATWSAADELSFQQWLLEDGANKQAYERWEQDWALIDALPPTSLARLRAMVALDRAADPTHASLEPARDVMLRRRRYAVAGFASLASGLGWVSWHSFQAQPVFQESFQTQRGQKSEVNLPDGSSVFLDAATLVDVTLFPGQRVVKLKRGQALFKVRAEDQRPFHVIADDVIVTVVGTRFVVRLTPDVPNRQGVEVGVDEGKVRVVRSAVSSDLTAGQRLVFGTDGSRATVEPISAEGVAPWRQTTQISFSDVPLKTVVAEMARYADLGIVVVDPAAADLRLTGTFDPTNAYASRRLLATALPLQVVTGKFGYELRRRY